MEAYRHNSRVVLFRRSLLIVHSLHRPLTKHLEGVNEGQVWRETLLRKRGLCNLHSTAIISTSLRQHIISSSPKPHLTTSSPLSVATSSLLHARPLRGSRRLDTSNQLTMDAVPSEAQVHQAAVRTVARISAELLRTDIRLAELHRWWTDHAGHLIDEEHQMLARFPTSIDVNESESWEEIIHAVDRILAYDNWVKMRRDALSTLGFHTRDTPLKEFLIAAAIDQNGAETFVFNAIVAQADINALGDLLEPYAGDGLCVPEPW